MTKMFLDRRTHASLGDVAGEKRITFNDCYDCGRRVYSKNAKRCNACAHAKKLERAREAALRSEAKRKARKAQSYSDMLAILGLREHEGDCV